MANRDIITVGASAGGVETLTKLVAGLPADLPASVFVVQHLSPAAPSALAAILAGRGPLRVETATDHQEFQPRAIYVAPPDHHLMVDRSYMYITRGPRENHTRPAVDPLFRSAAVVHGPHVIGVVLSGTLDDGTAGLTAIKRCGGVAVVQDPKDALYPDMPQNALDANEDVDYCVDMSKLPALLTRLSREPPGPPVTPPGILLTEVEISRTAEGGTARLNEIGDLVPLTCAECRGPLWQIKDERIVRFRCREGHSYTSKALASTLSEGVERSLWVAVQAMDERVRMLSYLASYERQKGRERAAESFVEQAKKASGHADRLRQLLLAVNR
jgi:two-component system chemotaxis response regulator CheB